MSNATSSRLRDAVLNHLVHLFEDERIIKDEKGRETVIEPTAAEVTAANNYLKIFPPGDELPTPDRLSPHIRKFQPKGA